MVVPDLLQMSGPLGIRQGIDPEMAILMVLPGDCHAGILVLYLEASHFCLALTPQRDWSFTKKKGS